MHVWSRQQCRWIQWHGSLAAWRRLPHAIVSAVCSGTLAAVLALPNHKPVQSAQPQPVSRPALYSAALYSAASYEPAMDGAVAGSVGPWQAATPSFAAPFQVADAATPPFTPSVPASGPPPGGFTTAPPPPPSPPLIPPRLPLGPIPTTVPPPPGHPPPRASIPPQRVPEPASALLLGTGAAGLLTLRRFRSQVSRRRSTRGGHGAVS